MITRAVMQLSTERSSFLNLANDWGPGAQPVVIEAYDQAKIKAGEKINGKSAPRSADICRVKRGRSGVDRP